MEPIGQRLKNTFEYSKEIPPTMSQYAFINDLYNEMDTPFSKRVLPKTKIQASTLIAELKERRDANRFYGYPQSHE